MPEPPLRRPPGPVPKAKSVDLHFRIPAKQYDRLYKEASDRYCSVPELIRELIRSPRSRSEE